MCRFIKLSATFAIHFFIALTAVSAEPPGAAKAGPVGDRATSSQPKLPVPDETAQNEAASIIKDVYKADYSKAKTPAQTLELARKLLQEGVQTEGDPSGKYVLLRIARDLGVQIGEVPVSLRAIDSIADAFEVDSVEMKFDALTKMSKSISRGPAQMQLAEALGDVADVAAEQDKYPMAQQLAGLAISASRNAKDGAVLKYAITHSKEIEENTEAFAEAEKALKVLETKPTDPDANLTLGKYRCFHRRDWESGLPLFALANDAVLKGLAEKESAPPTTAIDQARLGDEWLAIAGKEIGAANMGVRTRAIYWYEKSLPGLSGLPKAKIERKLDDIAIGPAEGRFDIIWDGGWGFILEVKRNKVILSGDVHPDGSRHVWPGPTILGYRFDQKTHVASASAELDHGKPTQKTVRFQWNTKTGEATRVNKETNEAKKGQVKRPVDGSK